MASLQQQLQTAMASNDLEKVARLLKQQVAGAPNDFYARYNLGVILGKLDRRPEAIVSLRRATQLKPDPANAQRQLADAYFALGNLLAKNLENDAAIAAFKNAAAANPQMWVAFSNMAIIQNARGDYEDAAESFAGAHAGNPSDVGIAMSYSEALETCGDLENAAKGYRRVLALDPNHADALAKLAITGLASDDTPQSVIESREYIRRALHIKPESMAYMAVSAKVEQRAGQDVHAREILDRIAKLTPTTIKETRLKMGALLANGRPSEAFALEQSGLDIIAFDKMSELRTAPPKLSTSLSKCAGTLPTSSAKSLIFIAADGVYAVTYADAFIASVMENLPHHDVHIHIVNRGTFDPATAFAAFPSERVTWTNEEIGPCSKAVYASRRFLRLPELLRVTGRTVTCLDIDSLIRSNITPAIEAEQPFDVLVFERHTEAFIEQMIAAGFFTVAPTPAGISFADFVASYIMQFESSGAPRWFVDQLAIISARAWFEKNDDTVIVKTAPRHILDWSLKPKGLIWTAKGVRKHSSAALKEAL